MIQFTISYVRFIVWSGTKKSFTYSFFNEKLRFLNESSEMEFKEHPERSLKEERTK